MRVISNILIVFGAIFIVFLIFLIIGYALFSFSPDIKSQMNITQGSADGLASYNTKVDAFQKEVQDASTANQTKDVTLSLTEDEINSKLNEMVAQEKLPFQELSINLGDNVSWIYFMANTPAGNAKVGLVLESNVVNNKIQSNVLKFQLGRLPLPKSFDNYAADQVNGFLNTQSLFSDLPLVIKDISIVSKQLTLQVTTIPAG